MEVKELAKKIRELNIETCGDCPFYETPIICKLHGDICIMDSTEVAKGLLQLKMFFETEEVKEILNDDDL